MKTENIAFPMLQHLYPPMSDKTAIDLLLLPLFLEVILKSKATVLTKIQS